MPTFTIHRFTLWLYVVLAVVFVVDVTTVRANDAGGGGDMGPSVTLKEQGNFIILSNGVLTAAIGKSDASISQGNRI